MKLKRIVMLMVAVFAAILLIQTATASQQANNFSPAQKQQIEKIIHNYLLNNPHILVEVANKLQQKQALKLQQHAQLAITNHAKQIFADPNSPVVGNAQGNITLVEFFDYQCGHCKAVASTIKKLIEANPNLRVVYKAWPIFGKNSQFAATAAIASFPQSKYLAFHHALMNVNGPLNRQIILNAAKKVGINITKLRHDMRNPMIANELKQNFGLATKIGMVGTPSFIIAKYDVNTHKIIKSNDHPMLVFIPGAANQQYLQKVIDKLNND